MSIEVETSHCQALPPEGRAPASPLSARQSIPSKTAIHGMTKQLFDRLTIYEDNIPRSAATNMAIDEALFLTADCPSIRFYSWDHAALSFGYFGKFDDVARYAPNYELVRRWTGGGIVFHGQDLTYCLIIPKNDPAFGRSSNSIYEIIHRALCDVLIARGQRAELAAVAAVYDRRINLSEFIQRPEIARKQTNTTVADRRYDSHCFANPVRADVLVDGRKVAGAAQRRTRQGLLQQGSIQCDGQTQDLPAELARKLSPQSEIRLIDDGIVERADGIAAEKYGTQAWLRIR